MRKNAVSMMFIAMALGLGNAHAVEDRNLIPEVRTSQDDINNKAIPFDELFYRGAHIYTNNFTTNDHFGEAPDGPRRSKQRLAGSAQLPFLRFNGLDAQTCFECHSRMGMTKSENGLMVMPRDTGTVAGSSGFASNVFIFENVNDLSNGLVRNPPHNFGLGYIQRLADEMTADLRRIREETLAESIAKSEEVTRELTTKGVSFGTVTAIPSGSTDMTQIKGVSQDLVVRPFQFKGIASSLRNFVAGALNFHFSVQSREMMIRHLIPNDNPNGTLLNDPEYEIMEGEVSLIAIFLAAMRPPVQDTEGLDTESVNRGRLLMESVGCTICHVPTLKIDDSRVTIIDPRPFEDRDSNEQGRPWRTASKEYISFRELKKKEVPAIVPGEFSSEDLASVIQANFARTATAGERPLGYTFDLNDESMPDEALPRLKPEPDGSIMVPLYSDLKRHKMGASLADTRTQPTDVLSILVREDEFLTRSLWGVADTGPWLHDGRATTLMEAILMHEGAGSEANDAIASFKALSESQQKDLVEFLRSLRVKTTTHGMEPGEIHRTGYIVR